MRNWTFAVMALFVMSSCKSDVDETIISDSSSCEICKTWVADSFKNSEHENWKPLTGVCWDDDLYIFSKDSNYAVQTGPYVGECSGCASCYFNNGRWKIMNNQLILTNAAQIQDTFEIIKLNSNTLERKKVYDNSVFFQKFKVKN